MATRSGKIDLEVRDLTLQSQQLDGLRLVENRGVAKNIVLFENGVRLTFEFRWDGFNAHLS